MWLLKRHCLYLGECLCAGLYSGVCVIKFNLCTYSKLRFNFCFRACEQKRQDLHYSWGRFWQKNWIRATSLPLHKDTNLTKLATQNDSAPHTWQAQSVTQICDTGCPKLISSLHHSLFLSLFLQAQCIWPFNTDNRTRLFTDSHADRKNEKVPIKKQKRK